MKEEPWGILRSGDTMLCLYENRDQRAVAEESPFHRIDHFGLRIRDRKEWEEILRRESLKTYYGSPVRYPHSTSWYVVDPSGHWIEVALWDGDEVSFQAV